MHYESSAGSGNGSSEPGGNLTLPDFIYSTYNALLEGGWRMAEIDQTDLLGFLRVRAWNARQNKKKSEPKPGFIDTVWPGVRPG